jgi:hypothetical protein
MTDNQLTEFLAGPGLVEGKTRGDDFEYIMGITKGQFVDLYKPNPSRRDWDEATTRKREDVQRVCQFNQLWHWMCVTDHVFLASFSCDSLR